VESTCSTQRTCRVVEIAEKTSRKRSKTARYLCHKGGSGTAVEGMANWKAQGPEEVHAYCTKNFITALHKRIAEHLQSLFDYWKRS